MALAKFFSKNITAVNHQITIPRRKLEQALREHVVDVHCGNSVSSDGNDRHIAEMLINLLSRLYPCISLYGPHDSVLESLKDIAIRINPKIEFITNNKASTVHTTVAIGCVPEGCDGPVIYPRADGWVAYVGRVPLTRPLGPFNPFASAVAGALAAGEVFRDAFSRYLNSTVVTESAELSLLDYGSTTAGLDQPLEQADVGSVALVGLGAVGNAAVWSLAKHPNLVGTLWAVDHETVELSNLQRYVLTADSSIDRPKSTLVREALSNTGLTVHPVHKDLYQFADDYSEGRTDGFDIPTICISVDNVRGRRAAQALLPELVINGWTGHGNAGISWHRFDGDYACLACLYHPRGPLKSQTEEVAEALGLDFETVNRKWLRGEHLTRTELKTIAKKNNLELSDIIKWKDKTIPEFYREAVCGSVGLTFKAQGPSHIVPLAHQSVFAGTLMAVELIKQRGLVEGTRTLDGYVSWEDVTKSLPRSLTVQPRRKIQNCICKDPIYVGVYRDKWSKTP